MPAFTLSIVSLSISLLPVIVFLVALIFLDSFKLVTLRSVLTAILVGSVIAFACLWINTWLMGAISIDIRSYSRYVAPAIEEMLKAAYLVYLIRRRRVGFMVDASILGFAVGAGFAINENIYYFRSVSDPNPLLWILRGFGTAIMHGGVTASGGILTKYFSDRLGSANGLVFVPGLLLAIVIHSLYNHFFVSPELSTVLLLIALPLLIRAVFRISESGTRRWLGVRFDTDAELLETVVSGEVTNSRVGDYLQSLQSRFAGPVVGDMVCMLRLHLELSIRAKGILLAREAGFKVEPDETVAAELEELKYLEKAVGKTGLLAVAPLFNMSDHDLWQLHMLGKK